VTDVARFAPPTVRPLRRWAAIVAVVAVFFGTALTDARPAAATKISSERARANQLLAQIDSINGQVEKLGQRYDAAQIKLNGINNLITHTREAVARIEGQMRQGNAALKADAVFAYVTSGQAAANNPLFSSNGATLGAASVYRQLAQGNVADTLTQLQLNRIRLTAQRALLRSQQSSAAAVAAQAHTAFAKAQHLQAGLNAALRQVRGRIAHYIALARAAAAAKAMSALGHSHHVHGSPAPPPNSRANIAIRAALSFVGTWYRWGGASRSGVDCSGLVMLAYNAAGIHLSHYSGAQWQETVRVPLYALRPGDLLFYGYHGDEHVAMFLGRGRMIEAEMTGTRVHVVPLRLGYGFAGAGRPRI
jgi:cell wall-associated NlpC family hydrolase